MAQRGKRTQQKWDAWRGLIQQWRRSELTIREFCQDHGVSEPSFYYWRRRIEAETDAASATADHKADSGCGSGDRPKVRGGREAGFAEVRVTETNEISAAADAQVVELTLLTGERLRIGRDVEAQQIQRVMAAVREVHGC